MLPMHAIIFGMQVQTFFLSSMLCYVADHIATMWVCICVHCAPTPNACRLCTKNSRMKFSRFPKSLLYARWKHFLWHRYFTNLLHQNSTTKKKTEIHCYNTQHQQMNLLISPSSATLSIHFESSFQYAVGNDRVELENAFISEICAVLKISVIWK